MGIADVYMQDAVTLTPKGTRNGAGTYDYDDGSVSTTGRVVNNRGVRRHGTDTELVYTLMVWLASDESVGILDKITIGSQTYYIKDIVECDSITGVLDHYEVYCG